MGTGDCGVMASGARMCHQALTGWQYPRCDQISHQDASSVSCTRAFGGSPRRVRSRWAYAVARTGETDPSAQGNVAKAFTSPPPKQQNAIRQLRQVTSTWGSFRVGRAANRCRRSDGAKSYSRVSASLTVGAHPVQYV
jgi:hypothetical protein